MAKQYEPEVRAEVMAALLAGQGVSAVSREYNIPSSTVSRWKRKAREEAGRSDDVGELLLGYLRENLETLTAQARHFRDPAWMKRWPAEQMAVLHGIVCDKTVRLLEALEGAPVEPDPSHNGRPNRGRKHV